jgi:hypothetical protein
MSRRLKTLNPRRKKTPRAKARPEHSVDTGEIGRLSEEEQHLLELARRARKQNLDAREEEWAASTGFAASQHRASRRLHEKLFQGALQAAGLDPKVLAKLHQAERRSVMKVLAERRQRALAQSAAANSRRNSEVAEKLRRWQALQPPSFFAVQLDSATTVDLTARTGSTSIAKGNNIAKTKVERYGWVSGLQFDLRGDVAEVAWNFLWTPPRAGLLNVITFLVTNGWGATYPGPGCVKGSSSYSLDASVSLTQASVSGPALSDSSPQLRIAEERYNSGDYSPLSGGIIFTGIRWDDSTPLFYLNQFPAEGNVPMLVTIRALLYVLVAHGEAELNFQDRGFQLNVPFVYLMLS